MFKRLRYPFDEPPEVDECIQYLRDWFFELGAVCQTGMGPAPVTWGEIDAFDRSTCSHLTPWEKMRLMSMSRAYAGGLNRYKDHKAEAPYQSEATAKEIKARKRGRSK